MEKDHHDRTIHALPFRNEKEPVRSERKAWLAPALIAALAVLLAGGWVLVHVLSQPSPVEEALAPPTVSGTDRERRQGVPPAAQGGGEVSHVASPEQKTEENVADQKGVSADSDGKEEISRTEGNRYLTLGREHEREGRDALAFGAYQEALRSDPASEEARSAAERVRKKIAGDQFQRHMSEGFTAYHKGDYALARDEFKKAEAFRPGSPEADEALALAEGAIKIKDLETLKREAVSAEATEAWEKALDLYLAALRIDGALQFALEGKERALERMTLKKRLSFYLEKPDVLESDDYLEKAIQLLGQAQQVEPIGPRHREEVQRLRQLIQEAQTRIPVSLLSDSFTEVSVFKVGKLGTFEKLELFLRPGKYTVLGSRNGYKDVRKEILVKAGESEHRITIMCQEKI